MSASLWYFAYGSNMSGAILRGRRGLAPLAARPACLHGYRLVFTVPIGPGERGVANVETAPGERICGVVHLLSSADCDRLDRTEGVPIGIYRRVPVKVEAADGERLSAFTYQSAACDPRRRPSARYLGLLLDGCREHGLPAEWEAWLRALPLAVDERIAS